MYNFVFSQNKIFKIFLFKVPKVIIISFLKFFKEAKNMLGFKYFILKERCGIITLIRLCKRAFPSVFISILNANQIFLLYFTNIIL